MKSRVYSGPTPRKSILGMMLGCALSALAAGQEPGWRSASSSSIPNRYAGKLHVFYPDGKVGSGSGVLVGNRHVLTAAHVLYRYKKKWSGRPASEWKASAMTFTPGQDGSRAPFGSANASRYTISSYHFNGSDPTRDVAVIRLNRTLKTGGFAQMGEWINEWTYRVRVVGYPGGSYPNVKNQMHAKTTDMSNSSSKPNYSWHRVWSPYNTWGMPGVSGGPLFDVNSGLVVRGIYTGRKGRSLLQRMHGFRLSNIPLNEIRSWIAMFP